MTTEQGIPRFGHGVATVTLQSNTLEGLRRIVNTLISIQQQAEYAHYIENLPHNETITRVVNVEGKDLEFTLVKKSPIETRITAQLGLSELRYLYDRPQTERQGKVDGTDSL